MDRVKEIERLMTRLERDNAIQAKSSLKALLETLLKIAQDVEDLKKEAHNALRGYPGYD